MNDTPNRLEKDPVIKTENFWALYGVPIALAIIFLVLSFTTNSFLSVENLLSILRQISIVAIAGLGTTMILISGGIDISMGAVMALSGVTSVGLMVNNGFNMYLAILIGLLMGCLAGLANGLISTKLKIPAFVTTMGMMNIIRGFCFIYTNGYSIYGDKLPPEFGLFGRGYISVIPIPVILMLILYVLFHFIANKTVLGTYTYAIGSNEKASMLSGIKVDRIRILLYTIGGLMAAVSGIILASRLNSAQAGVANGYEFDILTAVVLGGTSIYGGKGKISRTLLGAVMIGVLNNGMTLLNVSTFYRMIASGVILILALTLDRIKSK